MSALRFNHFFHAVADAGMEFLRIRTPFSKDRSKTLLDLCHELLSTQGEASGMAIARNIIDQYEELDDAERLQLFQSFHSDFSVDMDAVLTAAEAFCESHNSTSLLTLTEKVESRRKELFKRINMAPNGTGTLVEMRRNLLAVIKDQSELELVDYDLKHLLSSWFNRGFLILRQIDWETPAHILEKLIQYESVHEMKGWDDLRGRLADDRRCFAFFHPTLPNEPLIFVEVALTQGLAESIEPIIDANRSIRNPQRTDTAVFYSINNCQQGLKGISFGNLLIKQVVQHLSQEFPNLKYFSTLSPIPGFQKWLSRVMEHPEKNMISSTEQELLLPMQSDNTWHEDNNYLQSIKPILQGYMAYYLTCTRKKDEPLDPVARFHLRNGASLKRINWLGDRSANGFQQSAGMLANYVYNPDEIVRNHERYVKDRKFAISSKIRDQVPQNLRPESKKRKRTPTEK